MNLKYIAWWIFKLYPWKPVSRIKKQNISCTQKGPFCPLWSLSCRGDHYLDLYHHTWVFFSVLQLYRNGNVCYVVYKSSFFCSKLSCPHCTNISFLSHISCINVDFFLYWLLFDWSVLFLYQQHTLLCILTHHLFCCCIKLIEQIYHSFF